jgi:hypothetical protein
VPAAATGSGGSGWANSGSAASTSASGSAKSQQQDPAGWNPLHSLWGGGGSTTDPGNQRPDIGSLWAPMAHQASPAFPAGEACIAGAANAAKTPSATAARRTADMPAPIGL